MGNGGRGWGSVGERLPSLCEALGSTLSTTLKKTLNKQNESINKKTKPHKGKEKGTNGDR